MSAVWDGRNEIDGFNALVLAAGLTWRQATLLRAYAKYMRQGGTPFAQDYIEDALQAERRHHPAARRAVRGPLRPRPQRRPGAPTPRRGCAHRDELEDRDRAPLDDVASLDHDRILRSYLTVIKATLRTNYFQADAGEDGRSPTSRSSSTRRDPGPAEPRPKFEIFVYSPRVEGVHLRFGAVARGGLRWSDRRDDFRTEVLGLVKAQMVKNAVIVPVGAKGGFFCKQLPDPGDREAWMAEGVACYKTFISGLLDITDNLVGGERRPAAQVVRHDGDDSYLVVAADKGTATFSDIANGVAQGLRLLARRRVRLGRLGRLRPQGDGHHRPRRLGVGTPALPRDGHRLPDRGLHLRRHRRHVRRRVRQRHAALEHIRLVAAFDHRDIFLDPDPDAATSYAERKRLFDLPRSSWQDYDKSLISEGGGVYPRSPSRSRSRRRCARRSRSTTTSRR